MLVLQATLSSKGRRWGPNSNKSTKERLFNEDVCMDSATNTPAEYTDAIPACLPAGGMWVYDNTRRKHWRREYGWTGWEHPTPGKTPASTATVGQVAFMSFIDDLSGWIMSQNGFLRTTNGGQSWQYIPYSYPH